MPCLFTAISGEERQHGVFGYFSFCQVLERQLLKSHPVISNYCQWVCWGVERWDLEQGDLRKQVYFCSLEKWEVSVKTGIEEVSKPSRTPDVFVQTRKQLLHIGPCQLLMSSRPPGRSIRDSAAPFEHQLQAPHDTTRSLLPASQHLPALDGLQENFVGRAAWCTEVSTLSSLRQGELSQQSLSTKVGPSRPWSYSPVLLLNRCDSLTERNCKEEWTGAGQRGLAVAKWVFYFIFNHLE